MDKYIEIIFGKSSSINYPKVLALAREFSGFTEMTENSAYHSVKTTAEEIYNNSSFFQNFWDMIRCWQSTKVLSQGKDIENRHFPYDFFELGRCIKEYDISVVKEKYCNLTDTEEGWGCKYLKDIKRHLTQGTFQNSKEYWYHYGSFESEKKWKLNKVFIKDLLLKEAEKNRITYCPNFSLDNLNKKVDDLPDYIIIKEGNGWEIEYRDDFFGTTVQKRSIGVKYVPKVEQPEIPFGTGFFSKGLFEKGKDEKKENDDRKRFIPETTYDDIGGIDEIIDQVREVIELPLKRPDLYQHLGIKPHKGILLFGEPGNGKTLIAKAIANEVKAHFIPVSGSELISKYIGESEENLREIFKEARELKPSIIFFDEIDSVAQRRSDDEMNRHEAKFVNQLLTLMDGMEEYDNVTILASTNRPELLDEALLRPGRFDFKIEIQRPNEKGCLKILKIKTQKMPLDVSLDLNQIVPMLVGCSGSEITFIVKEAGMNALKRAVNIKDLISKDIWVDLDLNKIHVIFDDFKKAIAELKDNTL